MSVKPVVSVTPSITALGHSMLVCVCVRATTADVPATPRIMQAHSPRGHRPVLEILNGLARRITCHSHIVVPSPALSSSDALPKESTSPVSESGIARSDWAPWVVA
mmetsp:Transcript_36288/g.95668  ORF Transcript_36288/g.95668 Transcript_36288/m.95668 type:complete len:106 (+) Transcript_36288:159-476(+)